MRTVPISERRVSHGEGTLATTAAPRTVLYGIW